MLVSMGPVTREGPCPISHSGLRSFVILYYYVFSLITYISELGIQVTCVLLVGNPHRGKSLHTLKDTK